MVMHSIIQIRNALTGKKYGVLPQPQRAAGRCKAVRGAVTNSPLSSLPEPPYERLGQAGVSAVITGHAFAEPKQAQADAGTSGRAARLVNKSGTAKDHAFVSCSILQGTGLFCLFMMEEEP